MFLLPTSKTNGLTWIGFSLSLLLACSHDESSPSNPLCPDPSTPKRAFVTLASYPPIFGDEFCNASAHGAGLLGTFKAWYSSKRPLSFSAKDHIQDVGPFVDTKGNQIVSNIATLVQTGPLQPLHLDQFGNEVPLFDYVWTGTKADGTVGQNTCQLLSITDSWSTTVKEITIMSFPREIKGDVGQVGKTDHSWTQSTALPCDQVAHLYCFEQPCEEVPLAAPNN